MTEDFKPADWVSIWGLGMVISKHLPETAYPPSVGKLIDWAQAGNIPATPTRTGGFLLSRRDLPLITRIFDNFWRK